MQRVFSLLTACVWGVASSCAAQMFVPGGENNAALDNRSLWRVRTVWETKEVVLPGGEVDHVVYKSPTSGQNTTTEVVRVPTVRLPAETPKDWMQSDFDDSTWARLRIPVLDGSINDNWKTILVRGQFEVPDPTGAGSLALWMKFRGGAVVYVNGEEVGRACMPEGAVDPSTPAKPYDKSVYLNSEGFLFSRGDKSPDAAPRVAARIRKLEELAIPAAKLRKGVNVLAIAIHRAPTDSCFYLGRTKQSAESNPPHPDVHWAKIGLSEVNLIAQPGSCIVPNIGPDKDRVTAGAVLPGTGPLKDKGFRAWNQSIIQTVFLNEYPDPFAKTSPVQLTGVRNGIFAGQFLVADNEEISGLKVEVSAIKGPAPIPASAVKIRYALPDGPSPVRFFDSLDDAPPDEVPIYKEHGGALQPVWVNLTIPPDAKPGSYTAIITVSATGKNPINLPLAIQVLDWTLPPFDKLDVGMDLIESPESVALAYDAPLWSDAHLKLLDRTFAILRPLAANSLYVTCVRRTHLGNEHAQLRWVRGEDGEYHPDFTIVEKYLDVATKHLGAIRNVILYCWEPPESQGHAGGAGSSARTYDKPILLSAFDPQSGKTKARQGPAWGTDEAADFWKRLTDGIQPVLKKRGLENSLRFGLVGDARPTKQAMDDIASGLGPTARWAVHSHYYCDTWQGYKMGMTVALWGIDCTPVDPAQGYSFGWSNPLWLCYYPREMKPQSPLVDYRTKVEVWVGAKPNVAALVSKGTGPHGVGRIGVDFWPVLKDDRGRLAGSLAGRFPEAAWGQLNLNYCISFLVGRGKEGPVPTVRSESFRENIQEVAARIYIEKALLEDNAATTLGADLIGRCRKTLDERIRMCINAAGEGQSWFISSDWNGRNAQLFALAAEVSKKLGGREPRPNLKP